MFREFTVCARFDSINLFLSVSSALLRCARDFTLTSLFLLCFFCLRFQLLVLSSPASFELAYNASCALIESGDYTGALATVRKAESMCQEVLQADGASASEIDHELAGLRVQEAFILQQLSRLPGAQGTENEQALALYTRVLGDKATDPNVASIASNNIITLRSGSSKIWDSLKKSNKAMDIDLKDMTLSVRQRSTIQLNRALVLLHGRQNDKCRELLAGLTKEFHSNAQIALAQAAVLAKDKTRVRDAEESLRDWLKSNESTATPEAVQSMYLGLAHLALLRSDIPAALSCINTLLSKKGGSAMAHKPALVATLVALHERNNDLEAAHQTIQAAIAHWASPALKKDPSSARLLQRLLSSAGAFYSRHGREQDAAALLEALAAETQSGASAASRAESVARLVLAYAHAGNAAKEAQYVSQLPALSIPASLDVAQLESVPAPEVAKRKPKKKAAAASAASAKKQGDEDTDGGDTDTDGEGDGEDGGESKTDDGAAAPSASLAKAAARQRAKAAAKAAALRKKPRAPKRYPKGFDPANPGPMPDPERWLPRWERSNQKKFKRRQGNAIRGAQGSTNMANMPAASKEAESVSVESKGQVSGAAAAAARKRAGKKARAADKDKAEK